MAMEKKHYRKIRRFKELGYFSYQGKDIQQRKDLCP